jgi:hypothetical protein
MEKRVMRFDQFVNESLFSRAKEGIQNWKKKGRHANLWDKLGDRIRNWVADQYEIEDFGYTEAHEIVSEDPLAFEFTLYVYGDTGNGKNRKFRYTFSEDGSENISNGTADEVSR